MRVPCGGCDTRNDPIRPDSAWPSRKNAEFYRLIRRFPSPAARPAEPLDDVGELIAERRADQYPLARQRMPKAQFDAGEQQPMAAELLLEEAVVAALAVGGVADDGMGDVLHVAAQLVAAAGERLQRHQRVARGRVAVDGVRQFDGRQAAVVGAGGLGFGVLAATRP